MVVPKYHVFVCTSCTMNGQQRGMCAKKDSVALLQQLMQEVEERDLTGDVMISNTGCFGICDKSPVIVVYPEGVWYGNVTEDDIPTIVEEHFEGGKPVESLCI